MNEVASMRNPANEEWKTCCDDVGCGAPPSIISLQCSASAKARDALQMVQMITSAMFGIGPKEEKRPPVNNLRDALLEHNQIIDELCKELCRITEDLGCRNT